MLCENCGENEANVKYTQIINGVKKEMILCQTCSKRLGIDDMNFNMPINLSSFLGEFFEDTQDTFLPSFINPKQLQCNQCGMTYEEFANTGKFGCANCYETFENKVDLVLKNLHGSNRYIGRKAKATKTVLSKEDITKEEIKQEKLDNKLSQIDNLKEELKKAIKEERYEDAAKIRDEIKKLDK